MLVETDHDYCKKSTKFAHSCTYNLKRKLGAKNAKMRLQFSSVNSEQKTLKHTYSF